MPVPAKSKTIVGTWFWETNDTPSDQSGERRLEDAPQSQTDGLTGLALAQTKAKASLTTALASSTKPRPSQTDSPEKPAEARNAQEPNEEPLKGRVELPAVAVDEASPSDLKSTTEQLAPASLAADTAPSAPTPPDNWNEILAAWHLKLQGWALDGSLEAAAQEAFNLDGPNAKPQSQGLLQRYISEWSAGNFENLPEIIFLSNEDMNGAMGAFAASTFKIYLNADWSKQTTVEAIHAVLTEEQGHAMDAQLNQADTRGDEGELFYRLLHETVTILERKLSIQNQEDHGIITVNGSYLPVELASNGAMNDLFSTPKGQSISGNVLTDNGYGPDALGFAVIDVDGQPIASTGDTIITTSSGASVTINAQGLFTYNAGPADDKILPNKTGSDSFTYRISDGSQEYTATATIVISNSTIPIHGTDQDDILAGDSFDNEVYGKRGNDSITGAAGTDALHGGEGDDTIDGGDGHDQIEGDPPVSFGSKTSQAQGFDTSSNEITLSLTLPNYVPKEGSVLSGLISLSGSRSSNINIAYVIDISGSTGSIFSGSEPIGDLNKDGIGSEVIDAEIAGFLALTQNLINSGLPNANIGVIAFDNAAVTGFAGTAGQDANSDGIRDIEAYLTTLYARGLTYYDTALDAAIAYLGSQQSGSNYIYFLSDGYPNGGDFSNQVSTLISPTGLNCTIRAIGVGSGADLNALDRVDDGSLNGTAQRSLSPSQLTAGLVASSLKPSEVSKVEIYLDGTLAETLSAGQLIETPLGIQFQSTLPYVATTTTVEARAFLTDGTEIVIQDFTSPANFNDILQGGRGDDSIDGGAGVDYALYNAPRDQYNIISDPTTLVTTIEHQGGTKEEGLDTLTNVEFAKFSDGTIVRLPTINLPPTICIPSATIQIEQGRATAIAGASASDLDTPIIAVTLTPNNGSIIIGSAAGVTQSPKTGGSITLIGAPIAISNALASLQFIGSSIGSASLELRSDDGNSQFSGTINFNVVTATLGGSPPVNSLPTAPNPCPVEGFTISLPGFSVFDFDSTTVTVTLNPTGGSISMQAYGGAIVTTKALDVLEVTGPQSDVNITLSSLRFTAEFGAQQAAIQMTSTDGIYTDIDVLFFDILPETPVITLTVAPAAVTEDGTTSLLYTFTRTGPTTTALTVNYTVAGTAILDADYTGIPATPSTKTITFAIGSSTTTVSVDPTADTEVEADETVILSLATGDGYTLGTPSEATGTITNDDLPVITLTVAPARVTEEGSNNLIYTFTRTGPTTSELTINYTVAGTATLGTDYTGIPATAGAKTITFAVGSSTATLTVDPTPDTEVEADETVVLSLASGSGYTLGTPATATGTIDSTAPKLISIQVQGNSIFLKFSEDVTATSVPTTRFKVETIDSLGKVTTRTVNVVQLVGPSDPSKVILTLGGSTPPSTVGLRVSYTDPSGDDITGVIQDLAGNDLGTFTNIYAETYVSQNSSTLATQYRNLTLTGTANVNGTGNAAANQIIGNGANNILDGLGGNDTSTGGLGADTFAFSTTANTSTNRDTLTDFVSGTDRIQIKRSVFAGLSGSSLTTGQFLAGAGVKTATTSEQRFLYDTTTGILSYDRDGSAVTYGPTQMAVLGAGTSLARTDFVLVA